MQLLNNEYLNTHSLARLFSNMSESYKIFWFKAIVERVSKGETELSFDVLINSMIKNAWYMVTEYRLNLAVLYTLIIPFYIAIILMSANREMTVDKDEFLVTLKDNKQYVLIYKGGNNYYLEEAEISKEQIRINTEKVKIISSDDIAFETKVFKEVERK